MYKMKNFNILYRTTQCVALSLYVQKKNIFWNIVTMQFRCKEGLKV